jgi:hypothetical protein
MGDAARIEMIQLVDCEGGFKTFAHVSGYAPDLK